MLCLKVLSATGKSWPLLLRLFGNGLSSQPKSTARTFLARKRSSSTWDRQRRSGYGLALTAAEVPTEFVSVTEPVPSTFVGPEMVNGTVNRNMLPLSCPAVLSNHVLKSEPTGTAKVVVPLNAVPAAAVKVNVAVVMSRVTE